MPPRLSDLLDGLYQQEIEQLPEVQRAYLTGDGNINLDALQASLLAIKLSMINRKMTIRLAQEVDALLSTN
jgi:hypothetical protein